MQLENLGWNGFFAVQQCSGIPSRVAFASRDRFNVWTESGEFEAVVSGELRRSGSIWPAVGDWVVLRPGTTVIERVLERKTLLSRKQPGKPIHEQVLAANIDILFIVSGLDQDFNERRLERYLVIAEQSGARPIVLLNKADLAGTLRLDLPQLVDRLAVSSGVPVLPISATSGEGLDRIETQVARGETAALIGSSGVGKSTLVNRLRGRDSQPTAGLSHDDRGRHTTTARSMFLMPGGWFLIDMPGLREVQLWASPDHLDAAFEDILAMARNCRFRDCTHAGEPGCAITESEIDPARLENYRKLQRELEYLERKADKRLMSESRARWKAIHKTMRHHPKKQW